VKTVQIELRAKLPPFNAGERASFPAHIANKLVADRSAVYVDPDTGEALDQVEIVHIGGGYYEVGGERVKGKAAAEALYAELTGEK